MHGRRARGRAARRARGRAVAMPVCRGRAVAVALWRPSSFRRRRAVATRR